MSIYDAFNGRALDADDQDVVTLQKYQKLQVKLEKLKRKYAKLQRRHAKLGVKYNLQIKIPINNYDNEIKG